MKKFYSLIAVFMVTFCSAQVVSLSQAEYFWDTDPGEGSGTAISAADGNFNSTFENIVATGLGAPGVGLHKFAVRVKDNTGVWGPVFINVVKVESTTTPIPLSLAQAEYFWDTDPGEGNATPMAAADGNFNGAFERLLQNEIPIVNPIGLHVFNVRVKDNTGVWGPVFKNVIYIESVLNVNPVADNERYYFYPNPATGVIKFSKEIAQADILDLNGRLIKTSVAPYDVNIEGLAIGTYLLKVTTPEGLTFTRKMIKK